jgi:hypothetical protein
MGIELELGVVLFIAVVGASAFAVFEVETPWWRKVVKWAFFALVTLGLYQLVGHWALVFPVAGVVAGSIFHVWWCRKHGIDPIRATPRRRYYQLRGWQWPEG